MLQFGCQIKKLVLVPLSHLYVLEDEMNMKNLLKKNNC
jgi:hypothetical protein